MKIRENIKENCVRIGLLDVNKYSNVNLIYELIPMNLETNVYKVNTYVVITRDI
jgi:hypothetical protein